MWDRPTDDGIAAPVAETNMLPPCRHGGPETLQYNAIDTHIQTERQLFLKA